MVHSELSSVTRVGVLDWLRWSLGRLKRYAVSGDSMAPALLDGDWVFATPAKQPRSILSTGDIVVIRHPFIREKLLIKRVGELDDTGLFVVGDNPTSSTDSRTLGRIPWSHFVAKVKTVWPAKP